MSLTIEALVQEAMDLPAEQREILARQLLESIEAGMESDIEAMWQNEIGNRIAEMKSGSVAGVSATEVFERLRKIAPDV